MAITITDAKGNTRTQLTRDDYDYTAGPSYGTLKTSTPTSSSSSSPSDNSLSPVQKVQSGQDRMLIDPIGKMISASMEGLGGVSSAALQQRGYKVLPASQLSYRGNTVTYNPSTSPMDSINTSNDNNGLDNNKAGGNGAALSVGSSGQLGKPGEFLSNASRAYGTGDNSRVAILTGDIGLGNKSPQGQFTDKNRSPIEGILPNTTLSDAPVDSRQNNINLGKMTWDSSTGFNKLSLGANAGLRSINSYLGTSIAQSSKDTWPSEAKQASKDIFFENIGEIKQAEYAGMAAGKDAYQRTLERQYNTVVDSPLVLLPETKVFEGLGAGISIASKFASPATRTAGKAVGLGLTGAFLADTGLQLQDASPNKQGEIIVKTSADFAAAGYGMSKGMEWGKTFSPKQFGLKTSGSKPFSNSAINPTEFTFDAGAGQKSTVSQTLDAPMTPEMARATTDLKFEYGTANARNINDGTLFNIPVKVSSKKEGVTNSMYSALVSPTAEDQSAYVVIRTIDLGKPDNTLVGYGKSRTLLKAERGTTPQTKNFQLGDTLADYTEPISVKNEIAVSNSMGVKDVGGGGVKLSNVNSAFENIKITGDEKLTPDFDIWHRTERLTYPTNKRGTLTSKEYTDFGFSTRRSGEGKGSVLPESIFSAKTRDLMTGEETSLTGGFYNSKISEPTPSLFRQLKQRNSGLRDTFSNSGSRSGLVAKTKSPEVLPSGVLDSINADLTRVSKLKSNEVYSKAQRSDLIPRMESLRQSGRSSIEKFPGGLATGVMRGRGGYESIAGRTKFKELGKFKTGISDNSYSKALRNGQGSLFTQKMGQGQMKDYTFRNLQGHRLDFKMDTGLKTKQATSLNYDFGQAFKTSSDFGINAKDVPPAFTGIGLSPLGGFSGISSGSGNGYSRARSMQFNRSFSKITDLFR